MSLVSFLLSCFIRYSSVGGAETDSKNENNSTVNISAETVIQEQRVTSKIITSCLPASGFQFYKVTL